MRLLVTAGNTSVPVDRVRCLTNIFTGRTGAAIALQARQCGHDVTLLTSHPEATPGGDRSFVRPYSTFDDLRQLMSELIRAGGLDAVVHCAAVSDYLAAGVYAPGPGTRFRTEDGHWASVDLRGPQLVDRAAAKVKSDEPELWLRLVRAPKLIDLVRTEWGFRGILVKFKLEVGVSNERLLEIAERSRTHSAADLMVANTLEGAGAYAFLGPLDGSYRRVVRPDLAARLVEVLEQFHHGRGHG